MQMCQMTVSVKQTLESDITVASSDKQLWSQPLIFY